VHGSKALEQPAKDELAHDDRRAWVRYPCELESACQPLAGARGLQWPGKIRNVSAGGIAVRLARRFEAGTVLAVDVQGQGDAIMQTLLARVVHVSLQDDGSWLLGCAFKNPLSEEDLKALL
jgi:hypothetical protein